MTELDDKVLEQVRAGKRKFSEIRSALGFYGLDGCRKVDRSLQRLRKAGKIRYVSPGQSWVVAELGKQCQP